MRLVIVPIDEAAGGILVHNVADGQGHKALPKGHQIGVEDIAKLRALGREQVYVAQLEPGEVRENEAVTRIARAAAGKQVSLTQANSGRVNVAAAARGIFKINAAALARLNSIDGVALATVPANLAVEPKKMVATIKTIGLGLPERALQAVEAFRREEGPTLWVQPLPTARVALILTGSPEARRRVEETFTPPIRGRVEELGGQLAAYEYSAEDAAAIAASLTRALANGADCVILAGETSIMDADDVTPRGIKAAGGRIEVFGAPVEPGNLLLLAYCGEVPVIGAPGCVKSREMNVVDLILPRLLAGERVSRADVLELANGGLLL